MNAAFDSLRSDRFNIDPVESFENWNFSKSNQIKFEISNYFTYQHYQLDHYDYDQVIMIFSMMNDDDQSYSSKDSMVAVVVVVVETDTLFVSFFDDFFLRNKNKNKN